MKLLKIKKTHIDAKVPTFAYKSDAGMDLYSIKNITIKPFQRIMAQTGISIEIPDGYVGLVWDKSSLAANHGIHTLAGVIDAGFRGEIKIILLNTSKKDYKIKKGEKLAQMLIQKVEQIKIKEVNILSKTERGDKERGSSGS